MRILQLDIGAQRIEFHPYMSVLRGVDEGLRDRLLDALAAVSAGRPTVAGLVEAHGVVLNLNDESLRLLDLQGAHPSSFDIVVRRDQLPGQVSGNGATRAQLERSRSEAVSRVARAESEIQAANLALAATRNAVDNPGVDLDAPRAELARLAQRRLEMERAAEAARAEHAAAQQMQSVAEERVEQARALRAEAAHACSVAAGALEQARAVRDPFAGNALETARERLAALEAAARAADRDEAIAPPPAALDDDEEHEDPTEEIAQLENRRLELEAALLALDTVDPYPVQSALEQLRNTDAEGELVPSEEALALADELERAGGPVKDQATIESSTGNAIAVARKRLDAARAAVFDAERAVRLPEVDRSDVEALENAHEQVLLAHERTEKRLGGGRAKQRLEEVRQEEQAILDRLGYRTYTEFVLGTSIVNVDPEREKRLESARAELASAEDALGSLEAGVDAELARAVLLAHRRELHAKAIEFLGRDPGDDVLWALRHHRVRVHDSSKRAERLKEALESAGLVIGDEDVPPTLLTEMAKIWLDEQGQTTDRREQLGHELAEVETRASFLREAARIRGEAPSAEEGAEEARERAARSEAQLEDARASLHAAEQRLALQEQVEGDIAARRTELENATQAEALVAAALLEAESEAAEAAVLEQGAAAERVRCEAELDLAATAERQASETLDTLSARLLHAAEGDDGDMEQAVADAEAIVDQAVADLETARADVEAIDAQLAAVDVDGFFPAVTTKATAKVEELEWYLLSRVAAQRSVSYAGSVPLVLDDALAEVSGKDLVHLLTRLERMSTAVQVIVVSEDEAVATWADSVGTDRAMTLYPTSV